MNLLCGQYRKDDAHDPAIYAAALATLFSDYPRDVIVYATDPRTGLASAFKWLPQIAEVRQFLEDIMEPRRREADRRRRADQQMLDRARNPVRPPAREDAAKHPIRTANLFCAAGLPGYDLHVKRHAETGGAESFFGEFTHPLEGTHSKGIWVPAHWHPYGPADPRLDRSAARTDRTDRKEPQPFVSGIADAGGDAFDMPPAPPIEAYADRLDRADEEGESDFGQIMTAG